jgi:uncharacterized protein
MPHSGCVLKYFANLLIDRCLRTCMELSQNTPLTLPPAKTPRLKPPRFHWGGHLQTILASKYSRLPFPKPQWQRERWEWPEEKIGDGGDFCDADWLHPAQRSEHTPVLVLFHGLEGSSSSHYAQSIGAFFQAKGWRVVVPHFRGCSGEPNRLLRAYHSGDAAEIGRMMARVHDSYPAAPLYAVGVSLGGNALLCYLSDLSEQRLAHHRPNSHNASLVNLPLKAAASVCAPLDLARCDAALSRGFSKVYTHMFLRTLHTKAREKQRHFPQACNWDRVLNSKDLFEFDEFFTAPVHGYHNAQDYYTRASAKTRLLTIKLPTLLLNPKNDPFVPSDVLHNLNVSNAVQIEQPEHGGHVGFAMRGGALGVGELSWLPQRLYDWFLTVHPSKTAS